MPEGWCDIAVIRGIVNGVIGAAFDDEAAILDEGLAFVKGYGFHTCDGRVRHGEGDPLVA